MTQVARLLILLASVFAAFAVTARADEKLRRNLDVEWEAIEGASQYEVQLIRKHDKAGKGTRVKTKEPRWSANIKPGLYTMQVRAYDLRGVPGDWSPASDLQVRLPSVVMTEPKAGGIVPARREDKDEVHLRWESVPGADHYKVQVKSTTSSWQDDKETSDTSWSLKVPVGETFGWNVVAVDPRGDSGDENVAPEAFSLKGPPLTKPKVDKPISKFVRQVEWQPAPGAKDYSYELQYRDSKTKKWQTVESKEGLTDTKAVLDIARPSGRYRLKVQAHSDKREPSKVAQTDFQTEGGFRDPAAMDTAILRDSIEKPNNYYLIASYLITDMNFQGKNYTANSIPTFSALGGTGRIGLGYQPPKSAWGGFAIADVSGFTVSGQNFTFSSFEAHLTRKLELGQGGLLLVGTGIFSKELPIVRGSQVDGFTGMGKVREIGPHLGFTYWLPLTERYGLQANARVYDTLLGSTTTGQNPQSSVSYQYGLLGSYRVNANWMSYAGYAYRLDQARYPSQVNSSTFATPGEVDSINIQGHYLNVLLEYSF